MAIRLKWQVSNAAEESFYVANDTNKACRQTILDLVDSKALTIHFQPIFSSAEGKVFGYEALTRIKGEHTFADVSDLFQKAVLTNTVSTLDIHCQENAINQASALGFQQSKANLFVNVCPETMMDAVNSADITDELVERWNIPKDRIVLEITEESAIYNYNLFKQSIEFYRNRGYRIAIDDFGSGHGGLKMLSIIEPDFVKIDRHFVSNIDKAIVKFNLVDSIATACHRMGIKVIAEGIEQQEELESILNTGIELLQGYLLQKPGPMLNGDHANIPTLQTRRKNNTSGRSEQSLIGEIANFIEPIDPSASVMTAFNRFIKDAGLRGLPVVESDRVLGMLHRNWFLENQILGRCGYGFALNSYKNVSKLMDRQFMVFESNTTLEEVAQRINARKSEFLYDDVSVTEHGKYSGTVAISALLDAMTERSLILAKGANPLSGLPGNEFIQRDIEKKLTQNMHFDVCYVDINNFKPYNDHYGFERGDIVIKNLAQILRETILSFDSGIFNFVGHIGGDDFIVVTRPQISIPVCEKVIAQFEAQLPEFHGTDDCIKGEYVSRNRKGEEESFRLLSLSIGIVSTEVYMVESYAQLASIATEVKKAAKMKTGSWIERDRRKMGKEELKAI
ncbi:MAG: bifunctional diguanylate cyclase/phosphodiesterase [Dissulfurispiraceae bacterium]|jgi:diguanylate cyclase (GGDEF)-like protein